MIIFRFGGKPFELEDYILSDNCRERERVREGEGERERGGISREKKRGRERERERERVIFSPLTQRQGRLDLIYWSL